MGSLVTQYSITLHAALIPVGFFPFQLHLDVRVGRFKTRIKYPSIVLDILFRFQRQEKSEFSELTTFIIVLKHFWGATAQPFVLGLDLCFPHNLLTDYASR